MNAPSETQSNDVAETEVVKKRSFGKLFIWLIITAVLIVGGFATPMMLNSQNSKQANNQPAAPAIPIPDPLEEADFVEFGEQVLNLNDPRFSKYLSVNFSLQVAKSQVEPIEKLIEERNDMLVNWLISHVSDKKSEDLRGAQGANQLRREIHDSFNQLLFDDGIERIQNILYKKFNIQ